MLGRDEVLQIPNELENELEMTESEPESYTYGHHNYYMSSIWTILGFAFVKSNTSQRISLCVTTTAASLKYARLQSSHPTITVRGTLECG